MSELLFNFTTGHDPTVFDIISSRCEIEQNR